MSRKYIPLLFVLISGGITCIITLFGNSSVLFRLIVIFAVMLIAYLFGELLKHFLDSFEKDIAEKEEQERKEKEELEQKEKEESNRVIDDGDQING